MGAEERADLHRVDRRAAADPDEPVEGLVDRGGRLRTDVSVGSPSTGWSTDSMRPSAGGGELHADAGVDHEPVAGDEGAR